MPTGPRNSITDVAGILVGQAQDRDLATGVTVVLPERPAVATVDVRGGGPGTRETDALRPGSTVQTADAVVLSGGSAFGLDAAGAVMEWLRGRGRGFPVGDERVPIVPAAILFDLGRGARRWQSPPHRALAAQAVDAAAADFALGTAGAGTGAVAGGIKGGIGTASVVEDGVTVGALAAANPAGSVVMPGSRCFWGWWLEQDGEFRGAPPPAGPPPPAPGLSASARTSTTLAVVATDAALSRDQAWRVAVMAQDGLARAIVPVHTPLDGDVVFVLSTGAIPVPEDPAALARIGAHAADCVARAIIRGVVEAEPLCGVPAWRDL